MVQVSLQRQPRRPRHPHLKLALRECSSASAHEGALGGVGWRVTYEPHPKRRFKAPPFSSLGSLITDNSETPD